MMATDSKRLPFTKINETGNRYGRLTVIRQAERANPHAYWLCQTEPENKLARDDFHGDYIYSGIDRKNPARGYVLDNVVPCCKRCNYAKNDFSYDEHLEYLDRLVAYRQGQEG